MRRILITTIRRGRPLEDSGAAYILDWDSKEIIEQCGMLPLNARFPRNTRGGIRGLRGCLVYSSENPSNRMEYRVMIATNDTISVLNESLELEYTVHCPLFCNLHDLVDNFDLVNTRHNGKFAVSCGNDSLIKLDAYYTPICINEHSVGRHTPRGVHYDHMDRHGILRPNSVAFYGKTIIVSYARDDSIWLVTGTDTEKIYDPQIVKPHSLVRTRDTLYFTSAGTRSVMSMDLKSRELQSVYHDSPEPNFKDTELVRWGWLRGLCRVPGGKLSVGSSPHARILLMDRDGSNAEEFRLSTIPEEVVSAVALFKGDWN